MLVRALSLSLMLAPLFSQDSFACARARSHLMIALALALALARSRSRLPRAPSRDTPHASRLARPAAARTGLRAGDATAGPGVLARRGAAYRPARRGALAAARHPLPARAALPCAAGAASTRDAGPPTRLILGLPLRIGTHCGSPSQEWEGCVLRLRF